MKKLKTEVSVLNSFSSPMNGDCEIITAAVSTIIYNPIYGINYEEFSDANEEERAIFLRSKCREAEIVIATLSQMFEGEISTKNSLHEIRADILLCHHYYIPGYRI
ncbi:MAG: hypothetical protein H7069_11185 [Phormidesmis sp. FL-bin-119]|nr:hypothetical protein [Pedobacter sp.]